MKIIRVGLKEGGCLIEEVLLSYMYKTQQKMHMYIVWLHSETTAYNENHSNRLYTCTSPGYSYRLLPGWMNTCTCGDYGLPPKNFTPTHQQSKLKVLVALGWHSLLVALGWHSLWEVHTRWTSHRESIAQLAMQVLLSLFVCFFLSPAALPYFPALLLLLSS